MELKVATLFSGVGAPEESLKQLGIKHEIVFACDNGERYLSRKDEEEIGLLVKNLTSNTERNKIVKAKYSTIKKINYVKKTYMANNYLEEENWFEDIRYVDFEEYRGKIDLLVGGSPCQSFSAIGKRKGIEDARGTLFYDYVRAVRDSNPKFFVYENVLGITTINDGKTWERMLEMFSEIGYSFTVKILNAVDFGLPQNRKRVFVIGAKNSSIELNLEKRPLLSNAKQYLVNNVEDKYFLSKKGFEFVTNFKYKNRAKVNSEIIMCQKANQQFNWNGDFVFVKNKNVPNKYFGKFNNEEGSIRKMTPRECFNLMGFRSEFILPDIPDVQLYRQAGNSIAVNVLNEIIKKLLEVNNE